MKYPPLFICWLMKRRWWLPSGGAGVLCKSCRDFFMKIHTTRFAASKIPSRNTSCPLGGMEDIPRSDRGAEKRVGSSPTGGTKLHLQIQILSLVSR